MQKRIDFSITPKFIGGGYRETWIDICKGIGIILVLLAHAINKDTVLWISINQFHMPLFFFLSGYLYTCKGDLRLFIYKKIKGLYIPYIFASLLMYFVYVGICEENLSILEVVKILVMYRTGPLLGAIWFLRVLFWAIIIYDVMNRLCKNKKVIYAISTILLVICVHVILPLKISNIMVALGFIAIGNLWRDLKLKARNWYCIPCFIIVYLASLFTRVSVSTNTYTIPALFILVTIIGTIGTISFSQIIMKVEVLLKSLCWLGKKTIGIVIWQFVTFKVVIVAQIISYGLDWSRIWDFPVIYEYATFGWVVLDIIVGIFISVGIYKIQSKVTETLIRPIEKRLLLNSIG